MSRLKRLEEDVHRQKLAAVKQLVALEADYAKSIDSLYSECLDDLKSLLDKETKAGRLDEAVLLKEQIAATELARESNRRLPQSPRSDGSAKEAVADPLTVLKGTSWKIVGQTYEFDGSASVKVDGEAMRCVVGGSREVIVLSRTSRVVVLEFLPGFQTVMAHSSGRTGTGKKLVK